MRYRVMVYREIIEGVPRKQVTGQLLELEPFDDVFGVSLRLTLEDGRHLEFFVADPDGMMAVLNGWPSRFASCIPQPQWCSRQRMMQSHRPRAFGRALSHLVKPFRRENVVRVVEEGVRWSAAETQKRSARRS
jgi:hypothetical protein